MVTQRDEERHERGGKDEDSKGEPRCTMVPATHKTITMASKDLRGHTHHYGHHHDYGDALLYATVAES